jgi:hypothetical protein
MSNYPGGKLIPPKVACINHMHQVVDGWKNGQIKWVKLTEQQIKERHKELDALALSPNDEANEEDCHLEIPM